MEGTHRHIFYIHAVNENPAARDIVKSGDKIDESRFARAGRADNGGGLAGHGLERYARKYRRIGARIAETHAVELKLAAAVCVGGYRMLGLFYHRDEVEYLVDSLRGYLRFREHHEQRRRHGDRVDYHYHIDHERLQITDGVRYLHAVRDGVERVYLVSRHLEENGDYDIAKKRCERNKERENSVYLEHESGQVVVCLSELFVLIFRAVERADNSDSAELLAQDEIESVGLLLRLVEHRQNLLCDDEGDNQNYRNSDEHDGREPLIQCERHERAADHDYRRADNNADHHQDHVLNLADVVCRSRYQRGRAYLIYIALAQRLDLDEQRAAKRQAEAGGDL